ALGIGACGKKETDNRNIEQIQADQGIPVRQEEVKSTTFRQELSYKATLRGMEESSAKAMVSDVVVAVNARIGDRVKSGQTIVQLPQNTPAAQFEQATTAFNTTKQAYERMQRLQAQGAIAQQDLDNMEAQYKVSKANLDASRKMVEVTAPIDGIITNMMVGVSDHVNPGMDLFTVANTSRFKATLWVPETEIKHLRVGTAARAMWNEESITGRVTQIALALDPGTKAFRVEAEFANTNRKFAPGITVDVKLEVFSKANVVVVERQYIVTQSGNNSSFVWVNQDGQAAKRAVTLGLDNQLEFEVVSGLAPGEKLITQGIHQLTENAKLLVIE
ncbi:MAG: efflux RND transporter periplasmic adaptor subunit, partial [Candidatus Cloacimonadaceae bacterium]|nr:efflux RND transporter periplasmic adaptor subunit [Candidatus Cloacimonadaceae bacterium]